MKTRLSTLDYLRGLAAFLVMIYHFTLFSSGRHDAATFLGRVGVYAVSIFYILSGLTLFHVYKRRIEEPKDLALFFTKRILRIFPLFWLATIAAAMLSGTMDLQKLAMNLTGLSAVFDWDNYYAVGAWSIGNEMVFYLFLPVFVILCRYLRKVFKWVGVVLALLYLYFAFFKMGDTLAGSWHQYTNPFNQVFLFYAGFAIGYYISKVEFPLQLTISFLIFGVVFFLLIPAEGDQVELVRGYNRIFFTFSCLLIVMAFFKLPAFNIWLHYPLSKLGEISYSVYLLHPIIYDLVAPRLPFDTRANLVICIAVTLCASSFVYTYFEKLFIRIGTLSNAPLTAPFRSKSQPERSR